MPESHQILSVAQMRTAEEALIARGSSVEALMDVAGRGAADWVWRVAARHRVTVLCGPGNNGGDGYVIAQAIRERGGDAVVVAAYPPQTPAARNARNFYSGEVLARSVEARGEVFVDCLFGSGLTRPLQLDDEALIAQLAAAHHHRIAVDVPSGVQSDTGMLLAGHLCRFDLTVALGAWKFAHFLRPAAGLMGALHLIDIGVEPIESAAQAIVRPSLKRPAPDAHKYTRGLVALVAGAMPGAAVLAATAAQRAGAGYVRIFSEHTGQVPSDLVLSTDPLGEALEDGRIAAVLVGPGLGRDADARERLAVALAAEIPAVIDADALVLLSPRNLSERTAPIIATPHEGELLALERAFECEATGSKAERALAIAQATGMIIVSKGPDTLVAAPDGRLACAGVASSWLSTAGTGDVLAGVIASRLANGREPFESACEGVWLHAEAARLSPPAFTAGELARAIPQALGACL
ncbi:NAD(P)H-hydrate dehydratase [Novosphingobium sp. M1R2S20]|uniref:Bifunctional NAD(P)H-hydrate repair enzyme n=1 Tax=Novosphingobium rhizovicinum TaxID=3228928 RepID=A0ABV3R6H3_9SPHN